MKACYNRGLAFIFVSLSFFSLVKAQQTDHQHGYWFRYYNQFTINPKWIWHNEIDERRLLNPDRQAQFFIHSHIHYVPSGKFDVGIGFNYNESKSKTNLTVPEWRPWQEISYNASQRSKVKLSFRYRLDERFIHQSSANQLEEGYRFVLRHRIRTQVLYRIGTKEQFTVRVSDEIMLNTSPTADTFDQNRIYAGVEVKLSKSLSVETGYLNQNVRRNGQTTTFHILRTTLYHRLQRRQIK